MSSKADSDQAADQHQLSAEELATIEEKYDEGVQIRQIAPSARSMLRYLALVFAFYHYLTAGFGLP
ncbi:MAG: hypothetical protein AB8B63_07045, partial [Granulosicoccus sp.]